MWTHRVPSLLMPSPRTRNSGNAVCKKWIMPSMSPTQRFACSSRTFIAYLQCGLSRFQGRGVYPTGGSCRFPLIVLQQATQSFLATHDSAIPAHPSIRQGEQQSVLLALVIALLVVMGHVLLQGSAQRFLPEQDELRQAFLFHRSHPAFCIGVQIRTPSW